ncbi:MAG: SGNH/GDSL hydrolase family protein [Planctomycetota bacterium]
MRESRDKTVPSHEPRKRLSLHRKLLYLVVVCFGLLAVTEVGVRVMNRLRHGRWTVVDPGDTAANTRLYAGHTWLGQFPRPGAEVLSKGRHIKINSLGYRGREFSLAKPPGIVRIACIGGSTTFDVKVSDDTKTWPAQLENRLREHAGLEHVQIVNAATNGYALPRTIIDLALRTLDISPDWIVCYPGVNDVGFANRVSHQLGESHNALSRPMSSPSVWSKILAASELHNEIVGRIRYAKQVRHGNWEGVAIERQDQPDPRGMAAFERNLATLAGICQAHNIRLALVTVRIAYSPEQPVEKQRRLAKGDLMDHPYLSLQGHYNGYATANRMIRETAEKFDLLLIDQAALLPPAEADFADSVHFNDAGAASLAELAAEVLTPRISQQDASEN